MQGTRTFFRTAVLVVASIGLAPDLFAEETFERWEHLGAPPPGMVAIELRSESSAAPIQLIGTVEPPTLLFSGKNIALSEIESAPPELPGAEKEIGPKLWVNGSRREVSESVGRFFVQLAAAESAVAAIEVAMKTKEGKFLRARLDLNRIFLEAPFVVRSVTQDLGAGPETRYSLTVFGSVPPSLNVTVDGAVVLDRAGGRVEIKLLLPVGDSTLTARLEQAGGTSRVINLPVKVSRAPLDAAAPVLSLEVPPRERAGVPWRLSEGDEVQGLTSPGSQVRLGNEPADVDEEGSFTAYLDRPERALTFRVISPGGKDEVFTKELRCVTCQDEVESAYPGAWFFTGAPVAAIWATPRGSAVAEDFLVTGVSPRAVLLGPSLGVGRKLGRRFGVEFSYRYLPGALEDSRNGVSVVASRLHLLQAGIFWNPVPVLNLAVGPLFAQGNVVSDGFFTSPDGTSRSVGLALRFHLQIRVHMRAELFAGFWVSPPELAVSVGGTGVRWNWFGIDPIGVRFFPWGEP